MSASPSFNFKNVDILPAGLVVSIETVLPIGVEFVVFVFFRVRTGLSNTTDPVDLLCNMALPVPLEAEAVKVKSPVLLLISLLFISRGRKELFSF
jgi:hypothetical protein